MDMRRRVLWLLATGLVISSCTAPSKRRAPPPAEPNAQSPVRASAPAEVPEPQATAQTRKTPPAAALAVYFGSYTRGWSCKDTACESRGIYRSPFDGVTGALGEPELVAEAENPSYLAIHPEADRLFAVGEVNDYDGKRSGSVSMFAIASDGSLELLAQRASGGPAPCHVSLDRRGRFVLVANYAGGSVASLAILPDGKLGEAQPMQHHGSSVHPRQKSPHAHFIGQDPVSHDVFVADLGLDQILVYGLDAQTGQLRPRPPFGSVAAGSGPRHVAVHPEGFVYANNELSATVTVFKRKSMQALQTISTLPADYRGVKSTAAIQLSADGRFLYVSNRGHDSIAVFSVDRRSGELNILQHVSTEGHWPRDFKLSPNGKYLLVANKKSHRIVVFAVDQKTGQLTPTPNTASVSQPTSVAFNAPPQPSR